MQRTCRASGKTFEISDFDRSLYEKLGPVIAGKHYAMPLPTLCYEERLRQKLAFRNQPIFYRAGSCISGRPLVSIYSPSMNYKVCSREEYFDVDNTSLGRPFDFNRPFFEQLAELQAQTIKASVLQSEENLNTEYGDFVGWCKNCYMVFDSGSIQDVLYGNFIGYCRDVIDCHIMTNGELCYDCTMSHNCYELFFGHRCRGCHSCAFLEDCNGCDHCLGCVNLRRKSYHIFNRPVDQREYEDARQKLFCGSAEDLRSFRERFRAFSLRLPHRAAHIVNCTNASGDDLTNCENVHYCFNCEEVKDCAYLGDSFFGVQECIDAYDSGEDMLHCGELLGCWGIKGKVGLEECYYSAYLYYGGYEVLYSIRCTEKCKNLFGCVDLRKREYCILNKQYTREEYETLLPRLIAHMQAGGEWGRFFPMTLSAFAYNKSQAMEAYPASVAEVRRLGGFWDSFEPPRPEVKEILPAARLNDRLSDIDDSILHKAICCERCNRPFRVVQKELEFYRAQRLPLPRLCFFDRQLERKQRINPKYLWTRQCARTGKEILTTYAPDRPEIVISEEAFLEEFV